MAERYRDPAAPLEERLDDLLGRMTLAEKLAQIGCVWSTSLLADGGGLAIGRAREKLRHGIGHVTRIGGATVLRPAESAAFANAIQKFLREETRLGIPAIIHEESCAGYTARDATCFPQAIGLASTWDPARVERMGEVIRAQMRAAGGHHTLAPVLDVARDPRWGRTEETFGEDPYLISQLGIAYVRGVQGDDLARGIVCTGKHFLGYGASEGGLNWAPAHLGRREMLEIYALPFEAAIREAGLASMMNSYGEIDGIPVGASREVLRDLLRDTLGFEGVVVSDYFTVATLMSYHRVADDEGEAGRLALEAGIDVELPATHCYGEALARKIAAGEVDVALVDAAVRRLLRMKLQLGLFENPYVDADAAPRVFDTPPQRALARELARRSIVLLGNRGVLPLRKDLRALALIGPGADSIRLLQGDYHYPAHLEMMFGPVREGDLSPRPAGQVDLAQHFPAMVGVLEAIRARVSAATEVLHARGCDVTGEDRSGFDQAVAAAQRAEVAIVVVGDRSGLVDGCTSGESVDRAGLGLPGVQQELVERIVATGTPVVVVLLNGRPLALPWIAAHAAALVEAWLPGEEGGTAVAEVLFGDCNPSGRLPVTLPRDVGQVPRFYNHKPSGGRSQWKGDYADLPASPLFPFGHGLSYTSFEYADLEVSPGAVEAEGRVRIRCRVRNAGPRAGEEVVQLYVHDPVASVTRPVLELRGFVRVPLEPGESRVVEFELAAAQLAFYRSDMRFAVEPGAIEVLLGASSQDIRLRGQFEIAGPVTEVGRKVFTTPVRAL